MRQPPRFLVPPVQTLLWLGAGYGVHKLTGFPDDCRPLPMTIAGWLLIATGIALIGWAMKHFRKAKTSEMPWVVPTAFVVGGPYVLTRNPMYVGMAMILLGFAALKSSPPMLIAPIGFMITVTLTWIRFEESVLTRRFGKSYLSYTSRVGRWL